MFLVLRKVTAMSLDIQAYPKTRLTRQHGVKNENTGCTQKSFFVKLSKDDNRE